MSGCEKLAEEDSLSSQDGICFAVEQKQIP